MMHCQMRLCDVSDGNESVTCNQPARTGGATVVLHQRGQSAINAVAGNVGFQNKVNRTIDIYLKPAANESSPGRKNWVV